MGDSSLDPSFDTVGKSIASDLYIELKTWLAKIDPKGEKLEDYRDGIHRKFGEINIMGMASPRRLNSIYIGVRLSKNFKKKKKLENEEVSSAAQGVLKNIKKFETFRKSLDIDKMMDELGYAHLIDEKDEGNKIRSTKMSEREEDEIDDVLTKQTTAQTSTENSYHGIDAIKIVSDFDRLVVLGAPGSGKTTFLKYLSLAYCGLAAAPKQIRPLLPVFIPLRELDRVSEPTSASKWLLDFAAQCADEVCDKRFVGPWFEGHLKLGNCLILLDGIDEVPPKHLSKVVQSINSFSSKYKGNKIVTTCRTASFDRLLDGFQLCEVDDFNNDDRNSFIDQWFGNDSIEANKLKEDLLTSTSAQDLCRTPLLMTMICVQYEIQRIIPNNRADLYESCADALMYKWDTYRSIDRTSWTPSLTPNRKKLILSKIARAAFDREIQHIRKDILLDVLENEIHVQGLNDISAEMLLKELECNNGLIVERAVDAFGFSHLSIQEFFTALAYLDQNDAEVLFNKIIKYPRYREVFLMVAERIYNADDLIMAVAAHYANMGSCEDHIEGLLKSVLDAKVALNPKIRRFVRALLDGNTPNHTRAGVMDAARQTEDEDDAAFRDMRRDDF